MVYHSQDPMCPSQSKKLCFFPWCMVGKFLKKVLPFPVTTFVLHYPQWYGRWVTRMALHCSRERNWGGGGNWRMVRSLPLPPTLSAPVFRQRAIVAFWAGELETAAESSRRRRRRTTIGREGGGRKGAPQNFCRCERKWKFSPSASTKP